MRIEYTTSTSSVGMEGKSTTKSSSAGMVEEVCTNAGGGDKEATVAQQVEYTPGGSKEGMAPGEYTQVRNREAMATSGTIHAINTHPQLQPRHTPTQPWAS